jgi:hypothetical protein
VTSRERRQRYVVVCVAVGGHALVLWLLLRVGTIPATVALQFESVWLSASLPLIRDEAPALPPKQHKAARQRSTHVPVASQVPEAVVPTPAPASASTQAPAGVDWFGEAAKAAGKAAARGDANHVGVFTPPPVRRQRCVRPPSATQWKPEEEKFGFAGGLPYVRLGKRCVLGLGFFGCIPGKLPEANSHLLDARDKANESDSSVPAVDGCEPQPDTGEIRKE